MSELVPRRGSITMAEIRCTSSRGPCIWSGRTITGRVVLIIYRRGVLTVRVGKVGQSVDSLAEAQPWWSRIVDASGHEGPMPPRELVYQARHWPIAWPAEFGAS